MPINTKSLTPGLIERIRNRIQKELGFGDEPEGGPSEADPLLQGPGTDADVIMYRIRAAAGQRFLLYMKYNNTWRHVEPYSFKYKAADGASPLFFGWCQLHNTIEAYRIERIQDVQVTDRPYNPRFAVEI